MDWELETLYAVRVLYATLLGSLIGLERQWHAKEAGIRTYGAVCLGACVFALVSSHVQGAPDPTRIAAQVVSGIGFLGAGVILRDRGQLRGLTTAATLWGTAGVGLAVAYGMYLLAALSAAIVVALLASHDLRRKRPSPAD
jgi:putative Mg2+ transporter-C (MgtC) family protein